MDDFIEYNKDKTNQVVKLIHRQKNNYSSKEQYIVIMLEKILEEFTEPHFGYLKVNVVIKPMSIGEKITVDDKIKFYFWVNVCGITTGVNSTSGAVSQILKSYNEMYVRAQPKSVNGFKLMNDEKEMLALLLPEIENQGDIEYKVALKKREAELLEAYKKQ